MQLQLLLSLLVRYPGVAGTVAVGAGYFLHLDPLGALHWQAHDAVLGLQCALPVVLLDAALMLPDYTPPTTTKTIKVKVPRGVAERLAERGMGVRLNNGSSSANGAAAEAGGGGEAEAAASSSSSSSESSNGASAAGMPSTGGTAEGGASSSTPSSAASSSGGGLPPAQPMELLALAATATEVSPGTELVEVEREVTVRADQPPLLAALRRAQMEKTASNVGRFLSPPAELFLLLVVHFAEEMLYRAILLTWAAQWTIDRLYEAGVGDGSDMVSLLGWQLAVPQAGALFAAVGCAGFSVGLLIQRELLPLRLLTAARERAKQGRSAKDGDRLEKAISQAQVNIKVQQRWSVGLEAARELVEWGCFSTSFLLTGNLLAPYISSVAADLAFSSWQRFKQSDAVKAEQAALARLRTLADTAATVRERRKARLNPPAASRSSTDGSAAQQEAEGSGAEQSSKSGGEQPPSDSTQSGEGDP